MACEWSNVQEPLRTIAQQIINESGGRITCSSAFRTNAQQQALYNQKMSGKISHAVAKPGSSRHEHGLAIDFGGDMELLAELGPKYGLARTVKGEPWHWELGDDIDVEGYEGVRLPFEAGETSNPQEALANRLNAAMSIIAGSTPAGVTSPRYFDSMEEEGSVQAPEAPTAPVEGAASGLGSNRYGAYALSRFSQFGWNERELSALTELWNKESGSPKAGSSKITWNPNAANPTSSARGIAQKMTSIHGPIEPTAEGQIDWGLQYISGRYGSPSRALAFHQRNGWY